MRGKALLEALIELSKTNGIAVRREAMTRGTSAGGMCVLKGVKTVFVDERANVDAQIEILARVLRHEDLGELDALDPAMKTVLTRQRAGARPHANAERASRDAGPQGPAEGQG
ncbi:MAG: hypothetical protein JNK72_07490 [Myxococcales bacterium]|nr:hypothetical protein [Myxococcales bacterium]